MVRGVRARSMGVDQLGCKPGHRRQAFFALLHDIRPCFAIVYDSHVGWIGTRLVSAWVSCLATSASDS